MKLHLLAYTLVFLSLLSAIQASNGPEELHITLTIDKSHTELGELITISGRIIDTKGDGVLAAEVSIQVDGPKGGTVHIAFLYSDSNGSFTDSFRLLKGAIEGDYIIHVTASKQGYQEAHRSFSFYIGEEPEPAYLTEYYLAIFGVTSITATISLLIYQRRRRRMRRRMLELPEPSEDMDYMAVARALARLEELKARKKIDEKTYHRLKREYEQKLKAENP